ncbi:MAG: hypothetical protein AAGH78_17690 [Cyanobacteria bacterium P01_H01_bin.58]
MALSIKTVRAESRVCCSGSKSYLGDGYIELMVVDNRFLDVFGSDAGS